MENSPDLLSQSQVESLVGRRYDILDAAGGIDGRFDAVLPNYLFLGGTLDYAANAIRLDIGRNGTALASVAQTPNQAAVAGAVEALGAGNPVYESLLLSENAATAQRAFQQLSGEIYPALAGLLLNDSRYLRDSVGERLRQASDGETLLVHGGASGIGTAATMLGKAFGAAKIFTTISSEAQREASLRLGADVAIDYTEQDFVEEVLRGTEGRGVDVIVDIVAGDYVTRNYQAAAMNGRIVQIGVIKGKAAEVDLFPMLSKRLVHLGSTLRSRSHDEKGAIIAELERQVWPHVRAGTVRPQVFRTFPLEQARQAHELMDSGQHIGKIVLTSAP
ncbi:zinc-binding dehydrogenase [Pseudomonas aeruginosa]|nr:zinc-binding dehydrogenase [Pseudomonas aeruginosa]